MQKPIELLESQLKLIHFGTVTPSLVDTVKVVYFGQQVPIGHIANTQPVKNGVSVTPYEPEMVSPINKALEASGFSSYVFSKASVMVSVPAPNGEEKEKIFNHIRKLGEDSKIAIRNIRKKIRQDCDKEEQKRIDKSLQKVTDEAINAVDSLIKIKIESI